MIKIDKSVQTPDILAGDKASVAREKLAGIVKNGGVPQSDDFDNAVFNGRGVKEQLLEDQNGKCAYCETSMAGDYGAVEHYRPKAGWQQDDSDKLGKPGYYWLAYEWTNLLCSCDKCNRRKGNLFPLMNPAARDIAHQGISQELPLIINPTTEDPGQFVRFKKHVATPAHTPDGTESGKGRKTIDIFDLNGRNTRRLLVERRKREWDKAKALYEECIKTMSQDDAIEKVRSVYATPDKEFSGMFAHQDSWF